MARERKKNWKWGMWTACLLAVCALFPQTILADTAYIGTVQASTVQAPAGKPFISGSHMVWIAFDAKGPQIYYQNIDNGEKKQLTNDGSSKTAPAVSEGAGGEVYVAWISRRTNGVDIGGWTVWGMSLKDGTEKQLSSESGNISQITMDGADVVWANGRAKQMFLYNFIQGTETAFGPGNFPVIANGKALFVNNTDVNLSLHDFTSGETLTVYEPEGYDFVLNLTFNGTHGLFKQSDSEFRTKYVLADLTNPRAPLFTDLSPKVKKSEEYYQLYIGVNVAAWVQDQDGEPVLTGVTLEQQEMFVIEKGDAALNAYAFDGDKLVLKTADGTIARRMFTDTQPEPAPSERGRGSDRQEESGTILKESNANTMLLGPAGGELRAKDGQVILTVGEGVFIDETSVELSMEIKEESYPLGDSGRFSYASDVWHVIGIPDEHLGLVTLTFSYDNKVMTALQQRKLSIYRWEERSNSWTRTAGSIDLEKNSVTASIPGAGVYSLLLNDMTFSDVSGHWAQEAVELLATRGIVNGMNETEFSPDTVLTRAQFVKLLVASLGEAPDLATGGVFTDVASSHWAAGWIEKAEKLGLVQGNGVLFEPDASLTREQMIVMLIRASGQEQKAKTLSEAAIKAGLPYDDKDQISEWARPYAALSSIDGLVQGSEGRLQPKQTSTRAAAATVIYRLLEREHQLK